ncbi:MAG TPA: methylcobamide--CoM methyltransferase [Actinomycetota bacterium]|nr:methylcobamide--CoM methyltransferase [Actinomycetota bacterium]
MAVRTTVVGGYPKPPPEGGTFALRKTLHAFERGDATDDDVRAAQDELARAVIAEQQDAGVDLVTDGHVRWDDLLTPFARGMAGFEIGGLLRWFDNNVYYRRPVCTGEVEWRGPMSVDAYRFAASVASIPVKAVVPGPVTFARLSVDDHYGDHERFVLALARVLAQEAFELQAAGAPVIQIDEPALLAAPEDLELAARALGVVTAELGRSETLLATYFGDAKRLGPALFDLPVAGFGLDFVAGPDNDELVARVPDGIRLQAGIVDARNTRLEDAGVLARRIDELAHHVGADRLYVAPSASLEFLPREKAAAKLALLCDAAGKAGG